MATLPPVRCTDALRAALDERAAVERRSASDVVRLALEMYLGSEVVRPGAVVRAVQEAAVARVRPAHPAPLAREVEITEAAMHAKGVGRSLPRRRLARREMCEHRVPPTSYCSRCDA